MPTLKITQINNRFLIETPDHKLHILNRKALIWNMKNVFNLKGEEGKTIMTILDKNGNVEIYLDKAV